jgi:(p)ppGpp synthase/HD superfamily hydrolase
MKNRYSKVLNFIIEKHAGQKDKAGVSYVFHPITVALMCESESEKIIALLHDILEDTNTTPEELLSLGVSEEELEAIQLLTKPSEEPYFDYINRVAKNPYARPVKKADLTHNMDLSRLLQITDKDRKRREKYLKAYNLLTEYEKQIEGR